MSDSDDQRPAIPVLSYVSPTTPPLQLKYSNRAARRSLHLAIILVAYLLLMPVLLPSVDVLAQRNGVAAAALAMTILAAWVGISLSGVVFGVLGFIKSRQRNVRGGSSAVVGIFIGLLGAGILLIMLIAAIS